ncbi:MAG: hypothetical protein KDD70_08485 [Bdellovibrionales bacterium]|nr:hypothetical protein [Bdellovibrionales bacterium]
MLDRYSSPPHSSAWLLEQYPKLLFPRVIEERMLLLLKQGGISKWFSGIGQEGISVGATIALEPDEFILPLHRNLGVFVNRGVPLKRLFCQFMGKAEGFTRGRDRSFHFCTLEHRIIGMISHLGPHFCTALGIALSHKLRGEEKIVLALGGDGLTSQGDFHEALNVASVWKLPVLFIIENNGYALSTPTSEQYACKKLSDRAKGYGIPGLTIDGNDFLAVHEAVSSLRKKILKTGMPYLLECETFRMRGHEEASGTKYVPTELMERWARKDPILRFEARLIEEGMVTPSELNDVREELKGEVEEALEYALAAPYSTISVEEEEKSVFAPYVSRESQNSEPSQTHELRYVDAIREALYQSMEENPELILMGQDVAEYGGVFKTSQDFVQSFGRDRVRNTPLCESAIVGASVGLASQGISSVIEMQFADFASTAFTQLVNNLAKMHYRSGIPMPVTIRMPTGAGVGAGPFHSQTSEAWFLHCPGLKVGYPSNPVDAKGMLITALRDPNPVMFFEHKLLYRREKEEVPVAMYETPFTASFVSRGEDCTIITYGSGVRWAKDFAEAHPELSLTILDLRWLMPLDIAAIGDAVKDTGRVVVLHEAATFAGFGGELASIIGEQFFEHLDAPVLRCGSLHTPVPFERSLEAQYLANSRLEETLQRLLNY